MRKTLLLPILLFVLSCNKSGDENCTTSAASLAGSYKVIASKYKQTPAAMEEDLYAAMEACEKDDVITLKTNGTYEAKDLGAVCSPSNDDSGTWSYSGSGLMLDGEPVTVKSFNCKTLVLVTSNAFLQGDAITLTLQKQ